MPETEVERLDVVAVGPDTETLLEESDVPPSMGLPGSTELPKLKGKMLAIVVNEPLDVIEAPPRFA